MARVLTEEKLEELLEDHAGYTHLRDVDFYGYLEELNPWLSIETAPTDRIILIWDDNYGHQSVNWNEFYLCFTNMHGNKFMKPTHWCELPPNPSALSSSVSQS